MVYSQSDFIKFEKMMKNIKIIFVTGRRRLQGFFRHKFSHPWALLVLVASTIFSIAGKFFLFYIIQGTDVYFVFGVKFETTLTALNLRQSASPVTLL